MHIVYRATELTCLNILLRNSNDALCKIVDKVGNCKSNNIIVTLCLQSYPKNILIHFMYAASNFLRTVLLYPPLRAICLCSSWTRTGYGNCIFSIHGPLVPSFGMASHRSAVNRYVTDHICELIENISVRRWHISGHLRLANCGCNWYHYHYIYYYSHCLAVVWWQRPIRAVTTVEWSTPASTTCRAHSKLSSVSRASNSCTSIATNTKFPTRKSARYRNLRSTLFLHDICMLHEYIYIRWVCTVHMSSTQGKP